MVGLPSRLAELGCEATLHASGAALAFLAARGESVEPLPADISDVRPDLVAVGTSENPDSTGLALIAEARRSGRPSVGIVDHEANAAFRFRGREGDAMTFAPDFLAVPDEATARSYRDLGFAADAIAVCGHPHFDRAATARKEFEAKGRATVRSEILPEAGARPVCVFLAEQYFCLDPSGAVYADEAAFPGPRRRRVDAVLETVLGALEGVDERPFVVLRLHPKNSREEFASYLGGVDLVSGSGDPLPLVFCADLVVGLTTALLAEAAVLGRPVLPVAACADDLAWMPSVFRNGWPVARSADDVRCLVPAYFNGEKAPPPAPGLAAGDGDSIGRLAVFLRSRIH